MTGEVWSAAATKELPLWAGTIGVRGVGLGSREGPGNEVLALCLLAVWCGHLVAGATHGK